MERNGSVGVKDLSIRHFSTNHYQSRRAIIISGRKNNNKFEHSISPYKEVLSNRHQLDKYNRPCLLV